MEHLVKAIEKLAKNYGLSLSRSYLADVLRYVSTGDDKLMPRLLRIGEADMNSLCAVAKAVARPDKFEEPDRRLIRFFARRSALLQGVDKRQYMGECSDWPLGRSLERHLEQEKPGQDFCALIRAEVLALGIPEARWVSLVARHVEPRAINGHLTSAGRYLVAQPTASLLKILPALAYHCMDEEFMPAFASEAPEALEAVMDELIRRKKVNQLPSGGWKAALNQDPPRFETRAAAAFRLMGKNTVEDEKGELGKCLEKHFPGKYRKEAVRVARDIGAALGAEEQAASARWLIEQEGKEAVPAITDYIAKWNLGNPCIQDWKLAVLKESAQHLGRDLKPALAAAMQPRLPELRCGALELWIGLRDPEDATLEKQLLKELSADDPKLLVQFVPLAASWNVSRVAARLWKLVEHRSKPVREAVAKALGQLGDEAVADSTRLLSERKVVLRMAGAQILLAIATERACNALRSHLAQETADDVRDLIRKGLAKIPPKGAATPGAVKEGDSGPALRPKNAKARRETIAAPPERPGANQPPASTMKPDSTPTFRPDPGQIEAAIAGAAKKIKEFPVAWLQESSLPALHDLDGKALGRDGVRYLFYRQAREKEIQADTEAALLYARIDRKTSGDFALAVLNGYLQSPMDAKDRWALAVAGLLGDDRIVPVLARRIAEWAEAARGKLAEYAVQALALLASDAALLAVDAMAIRYRTKFKNIGKAASQAFAAAADARGLSPAELGDRVLPWLGFEPGKPRLLEFAGNRIEVSLGLDFKLAWRDLVKGKSIKSLPSSVPDEIKTEMKEVAAGLKEAAKAQLLRLENLMVQQHRWPVARWKELFLGHPLVFPFAVRLIWGLFDAGGKLGETFRALEDHSLTDSTDEPFNLPSTGVVGIAHPLELTPEQRQAWVKHLADYNVVPPFPQLARPVVTVKPGQEGTRISKELEGTEMNAMTFKGRAERLGWSRGSVVDAGCVNYYWKQFPAAGVDVLLAMEGMFVGIDMYSDITLGHVLFVKHRSVKMGSYTYDEPQGENEERIVPFGAVPRIAFSEAMGDLARISGKSEAQKEEADA